MLPPILSIQSHVVYGHVGNSAAVFPLQRLKREVWPLMTVQFSSHTGYPGFKGRAFDAAMIDECMSGLDAIGALARCAGLLTGYLGRPEIGEAALRALDRIRAANPDTIYACDPVIGDAGRAYVAGGVAEFFRDRALPRATIVTPNAFELEWLTGMPAGTLGKASAALVALHFIAPDAGGVWRLRTPRLPISVNGAGDLFAALFLHHWLLSRSAPEALSRSASSVFGVIAATLAAGTREIALIAAQQEIVKPSKVFAAEAAPA